MSEKKKPFDRFVELSWNDLNQWVGSKIVSQGRNCQQQGQVTELAVAEGGALIAWVNGSERYATRVVISSDDLPESICTCPYELDCKHGVAVLLEYLEMVGNRRSIPLAGKEDLRMVVLENDDWNVRSGERSGFLSEHLLEDVEIFIGGKTNKQLRELIVELSQKYPEIAQDLSDRCQIFAGNIEAVVSQLRREIRDIGREMETQGNWQEDWYPPDFSKIRTKLENLLAAGYCDEVLGLGQELIEVGTHQIEQSHDDGETVLEIESCMPSIIKALERSSLSEDEKLVWAVDAVLKDKFDICEVFGEFLYRRYSKTAWNHLADYLMSKLNSMASVQGIDNFIHNFERDRLSNWTIHALERAGRKDEIIPLCQAEAKITGSYNRLVKALMEVGRNVEAEAWIMEGIVATKDKMPGITALLNEKLLKIRMLEKNWPDVVTMQVERYVQSPTRNRFLECKKAAEKIGAWPQVRKCLLVYLERGTLPWQQPKWPLRRTHQSKTVENQNRRFPMLDDLIEIAIMEKIPEQVLYWFDKILNEKGNYCGIDNDAVATALESYAPQRAVSIWQVNAERLIEQVKPNAYQEAVKYLRKAGAVMERENMQDSWRQYIRKLRTEHIRKRRLIEILDGLEGRPIVRFKN